MIFKSDKMNLNFNNAVAYLTFKDFEKYDFVKHAFSTRISGVSQNEFASMNLSFNRGDPKENVIENYHRFCKAVELDFSSLVASSQDHGTYIREVNEKDKGIGIWREKDIKSVDGLVTDVKNVTLVTYYADCVPLFFIDPVNRVVGLAHSGWRGTLSMIGGKMIEKMNTSYNCDVSNIVVGIGPSIGPCCYEVDFNVASEFYQIKEFGVSECIKKMNNNKYMLNLWEINRKILLNSGVLEKNIIVTDLCTSCNSDLLFSHRKTGGKRGGMAAMICIN